MSEDVTNSPEFKAALKAAVEDATAPLLAKRDELLSEVKTLRKGKAINPEDVEKLENEIESLKAANKDLDKTAKKAVAEADTAKKTAADADSREQRLLIENGLNDALTKAGVTNPAYAAAAKALLASQLAVVADGDTRVVKAGDKALGEFVSEWALGESGKHFVAAPAANGGGSQGGRGNSNGKTMTQESFDALPVTERAARMADGYTLT